MLLHDLLGATDVLELVGDSHVVVLDIAHDSRRVIPGSLYCCVPGAQRPVCRSWEVSVRRVYGGGIAPVPGDGRPS